MVKVRISSRRARALAREGKTHLAKIGRAGVELRFDHAGVHCPACGYVFNNGVTPLGDHAAESIPELNTPPNPGRAIDGQVGVCTRCRRVLVLDAGRFRLMDPIEQMSLSREELGAIEFLRAIARETTVKQS